jgi:hypothetical protein
MVLCEVVNFLGQNLVISFILFIFVAKTNHKAMKKILKFTMLSAVLLSLAGAFFSCEQKEPTPVTTEPFLTVNETPMAVLPEGGEFLITVESNGTWTAVVEDAENDVRCTWCTLSNNTETGNDTIIINILGNVTYSERSAVVKITMGTLSKSVTINQDVVELFKYDFPDCEIIDPLTDIAWLREYRDRLMETQDLLKIVIYVRKVINKDKYVFQVSHFYPLNPPDPVQGDVRIFTEWWDCSGKRIFLIRHPGVLPPDYWALEKLLDVNYGIELFHFVK